jgi:hypothetical protein
MTLLQRWTCGEQPSKHSELAAIRSCPNEYFSQMRRSKKWPTMAPIFFAKLLLPPI